MDKIDAIILVTLALLIGATIGAVIGVKSTEARYEQQALARGYAQLTIGAHNEPVWSWKDGK